MHTYGAVRCVVIWVTAALTISAAPSQGQTVKLTGWFACNKCTAERVARGDIRPGNPVCAKDCIDKGDDPVFLSEQGKESLKVRNCASAVEELGYHVEVTGIVDPIAKTFAIAAVKRLSYEGASCNRPRRTAKK